MSTEMSLDLQAGYDELQGVGTDVRDGSAG